MRPCPPNGLARAAWWRDFAVATEDTDPQHAAYCRSIAAAVERRILAEKPLFAWAEGEHVSPP